MKLFFHFLDICASKISQQQFRIALVRDLTQGRKGACLRPHDREHKLLP
jgi:hypothetical protein